MTNIQIKKILSQMMKGSPNADLVSDVIVEIISKVDPDALKAVESCLCGIDPRNTLHVGQQVVVTKYKNDEWDIPLMMSRGMLKKTANSWNMQIIGTIIEVREFWRDFIYNVEFLVILSSGEEKTEKSTHPRNVVVPYHTF